MVGRKLFACQIHDPSRGPFDPQTDVNASMATETLIMRVGKTRDHGERHREAQVRRDYCARYRPTNSREYRSRVMIRFRKNRAAGVAEFA